jgi:hypothetical protein
LQDAPFTRYFESWLHCIQGMPAGISQVNPSFTKTASVRFYIGNDFLR